MTNSAFGVIVGFLKDLFTWTLDGILWLLAKAFYLPFDGLLTVISSIFTAIDLSAFVASYAMNWAGMPPQLIWFVNAVSIPQGISIYLAAITIRKLADLIPSWATRF